MRSLTFRLPFKRVEGASKIDSRNYLKKILESWKMELRLDGLLQLQNLCQIIFEKLFQNLLFLLGINKYLPPKFIPLSKTRNKNSYFQLISFFSQENLLLCSIILDIFFYILCASMYIKVLVLFFLTKKKNQRTTTPSRRKKSWFRIIHAQKKI